MALALALQNALQGLNVTQRTLNVLSHNVANANTPGYSRQVANLSPNYLEGVGTGVRIEDVVRKVDKYLQVAARGESSSVGEAATLEDYLDRVQILLGQPGKGNSLDNYIENFFNAFQQLAETPERASFRRALVNSGVALSREMGHLAQSIEDLRYQADQDIAQMSDSINADLQHLFNVNQAIERAYALNLGLADLEDERDIALKSLAEKISIDTFFHESGSVDVFTERGVALVDDNLHRLEYTPANSVTSFTQDAAVSALTVTTLSPEGDQISQPVELISAGVEDEVSTIINSGKIKALKDLRDTVLPEILQQLDMLADRLRDQINALHNDGSGFPPAASLTGTRLVAASQAYDWSGKVRIAVLNDDGTPVTPAYTDETYTGVRPLTLDLSRLDSGLGQGQPTIQAIINEINNQFGAPPVKTKMNNLNSIQMVSQNDFLPFGVPPSFTFDFDLENISGADSDFFITNVTVLDDTGTNITNTSNTLTSYTLDPVNTYTTTSGSNAVTITTGLPHNFTAGDYIYLNDPGALPPTINGIPSALLVGYFRVESVTSPTTFTISAGAIATATGAVAQAGVSATPPYDTIEPGEKRRTNSAGSFTADLTGSVTTAYYDITVNVGVINRDPEDTSPTETGTITYRIYNNDYNMINRRFNSTATTGTAARVLPQTSQFYLHAKLVDADGNELPKTNGSYEDGEGYLVIEGNDLFGYRVAIDELDSQQQGVISQTPAETGTYRGFSHFFELNNFFKSNNPIASGDTRKHSALYLEVEDRIVDDPNLVSTGDLVRSPQPVNPNLPPQYTYERYVGDNSLAQALAKVGVSQIDFDEAGGLPTTSLTFNNYVGNILGNAATNAAAASRQHDDSKVLMDGFQARLDAIAGVNMDEELANTIVYQNAYAANARVITVVNQLFEELIGIFR